MKVSRGYGMHVGRAFDDTLNLWIWRRARHIRMIPMGWVVWVILGLFVAAAIVNLLGFIRLYEDWRFTLWFRGGGA